jgi:hypothetical protein
MNHAVEIGAIDYKFGIQAIIGFDLLIQARVKIDLEKLEICA